MIKEAGGVTTVFHYDFNGNIIGESDLSGNFTVEYLYRGKGRLAMVDVSTEAIYYYLNDRLGTPQMLTDATNTVVWEGIYKPFGEADVNPNSSVVNNFRFAGQYFDEETGLHYNYFRYFDPSTGRYLTPDPIGQTGGINLFTYVENNPVNTIDPFGLFRYPTTGPIRGRDRLWGSGAYQSSRDGGTRRHAGIDYSGSAGSFVYAPMTGYIEIIEGGVRITGRIDGQIYSTRILHIGIIDDICEGRRVSEDDIIGTIEDLSADYPGITNHAHVELYRVRNDQTTRLNPQNYIPDYYHLGSIPLF